MASPVATIGCNHTCPHHNGGPLVQGSPNVFVNGKNLSRVADQLQCGSSTDAVAQGSPTVFVNNMPAARLGDPTTHGGTIVEGEQKILIG